MSTYFFNSPQYRRGDRCGLSESRINSDLGITRIKKRKPDAADAHLLLAPEGRHVYRIPEPPYTKAPAGRLSALVDFRTR